MLRAFRPTALLLAMTAMLLGAMLPAGWMPDANGMPVMCSLDHASGKQLPGNDSRDNRGHECPFAAAPHLAPPLAIATLAAPVSQDTARRLALGVPSSAHPAAYAPQSPRAPPA